MTPTFRALRAVPDLELVSIDLGPELFRHEGWDKLRALMATVPAVASFARLARYVRRNHIRIVYSSDRPRDALTCVLLARLTATKSVIHCHNGYGPWMSRALQWALRHADARIAVSDFVARSFIEHGYEPACTHVVHNAIDPTPWVPRRGREGARRELELPTSAPVVVTVCRLFPSKGVEELIRAVAFVCCDHSDVRLVIVGRDLTPDGSYQRCLADLVHDLDLDEHVVFTGQREDVPRLMAAADIFAMPSHAEPFGLVFAEAMAMELPVVALDAGGAPEVVDDGRTGLLSEPGDIDGLAQNLAKLLADGGLRAEMGSAGRERVLQLFTTERQARAVAHVFRLVESTAIGGS
jgi:glycosyltransferase involved in cell wall biosynthesis